MKGLPADGHAFLMNGTQQVSGVTLRDTVSFASPWRRFDELGHMTDPDAAAAAEAAMAVFAHRLDWWVEALAHARHARPYDPRDDG